MQIPSLTLTIIVALPVLGFALFSIARKLRKSEFDDSPLQGLALDFSRIYATNFPHPVDNISERLDDWSPRIAIHAEESANDDDDVEAAENVPQAPIWDRVVPPAPVIHAAVEVAPTVTLKDMDRQEIEEQPAYERHMPAHVRRTNTRAGQTVGMPDSAAPSDHYLVKAFLIGISIVLLVQTQRSAFRNRSVVSSRQDVA